MNSHLTERQISELMIDGGNPEHAAHLTSCATCAKEVADLRGALSQFRGSVHDWSADHMNGQPPARPVRQRLPFLKPAAVLAFLLLLGIGTARFLPVRTGPDASPQIVSDAALLDEVRFDVSRSVPGNMTPLAASFDTGR